MTNSQTQKEYEMGMIGLGVMGRNLVLNMADHGYSVVGYDSDSSKVEDLKKEVKVQNICGVTKMQEFISLLRTPRVVMMLVPAGVIVDSVIKDLLSYLKSGDLIIDAGNSHFKDTNLRIKKLAEKDIQYLGVGISGGEEGARFGPSIMPGGSKESYDRVGPIFEAIAAKVNGLPCVSYLGPGSAGHFVKMVHNGIEYALMQLISETYDMMKRVFGLNNKEIYDVCREWNNGKLKSFLVEITSNIFDKTDKVTSHPLIDEILDVAKQKGTGMWTTESAMELQVPIPTIDIAVTARYLSALQNQRKKASSILKRPVQRLETNRQKFLGQLYHSLYAGMIISYAQGFTLLAAASDKYQYRLDLKVVARIWQGGCIIRAAILKNIEEAFQRRLDLPNLLIDPNLSEEILSSQEYLRQTVSQAAESGIPVPGLMASLSYFDAYRSNWLPANLIQAQRDYFGAHTYERIDVKGTFHTEWKKK